MLELRFDHAIECEPDRFWSGFFDPGTISDFYTRGIGFHRYAILRQGGDDRSVHREVHCLFPVRLLRPLKSMFGGGFEFVEHGDFDRSTESWTFQWIPSVLPERLRFGGRMRVHESGPGRGCQRIAEMHVDARVHGLGRLLEHVATRLLRQTWDESAAVLNQWLADGLWGPPGLDP